MSPKTIILERIVNGRIHRTRLTRPCFLHCEIIEVLFNRLARLGRLADIDELFKQVIDKY